MPATTRIIRRRAPTSIAGRPCQRRSPIVQLLVCPTDAKRGHPADDRRGESGGSVAMQAKPFDQRWNDYFKGTGRAGVHGLHGWRLRKRPSRSRHHQIPPTPSCLAKRRTSWMLLEVPIASILLHGYSGRARQRRGTGSSAVVIPHSGREQAPNLAIPTTLSWMAVRTSSLAGMSGRKTSGRSAMMIGRRFRFQL